MSEKKQSKKYVIKLVFTEDMATTITPIDERGENLLDNILRYKYKKRIPCG